MSVEGEMTTLGACTAYAQQRLPRLEADLLVCAAASSPRAHLYAFQERPMAPARRAHLREWVARRRAGEPLAYILRERGFWGLRLEVNSNALIPRPDTETLVAAALPLVQPGARVLDVCAGCGTVALAIAAERPAARLLATDIDADCVALCQRNAKRHGLTIEARRADLFNGLTERFDVIVSNPPYVAADDPHLRQGDLRHEPRRALVGGPTGLEFLARLVAEAPAPLQPGGWLAVEHGHDQGPPVRELFATAGFTDIRSQRDIDDRPRVTLGRKP